MSHEAGAGARERPNAGQLLAGTAANGQLRWVTCDLTRVVEHARLILDLSPLATVAFGRALAACAMLLRLASKRPRRLTVDLRGAGPLERILAECDAEGHLRGIVGARRATNSGGPTDLHVGEGVGLGLMIVRREEEDGQSYESRVVLKNGEIGTDVAHYLEQSEQRQAAVLVGVHLTSEGVTGAGGMIVEALPSAAHETVVEVERRILGAGSISALAADGAQHILETYVGPSGPRTLEQAPLTYACGCDRERVIGSLSGLAASDLAGLTSADGSLDAECGYCGRTYRVNLTEVLGETAN